MRLTRSELPCLMLCEKRFLDQPVVIPEINVNQHPLSQYNVLITQGAVA